MSGGVLVLAATPIGDSRDAAPRLADELRAPTSSPPRTPAGCAASARTSTSTPPAGSCPSTSTTRPSAPPSSSSGCAQGDRVVVVTDAGMPSVSDPGYRLVSAAVGIDVRVTGVPGPSAVLMALAVSGLPVDRFCFEGFLRAGPANGRAPSAGLAAEPRTMVFFEARTAWPARSPRWRRPSAPTGERAVCRELTKTYEEVRRGALTELVAWASDGVRGEVTLVVAGCLGPGRRPRQPARGHPRAGRRGRAAQGRLRRRRAATGLSKKALYDAAVASRA